MSGSHEKLPGFFWVQLVAAAIVGILWLLAPSEGGHDEVKADPVMASALQPIGSVALAKPAEAPGAPRSGDSIVENNCKVCHAIGLANAPKLDAGAKADWEARMTGGFDPIVTSAIKGKGGMPPRGGDATLTDDEIADAIKSMLAGVGVEVAEAAEAKESASTAETTEANESASTAETAQAKEKAVGENTEATESKVAEAETTEEQAETTEAAKQAAETEVKKAESVAAKPAAIVATKLGESTYKSSCFACHDSGVANSPKFGDKAVWDARMAAGIDALHASAIKGKGAMPAKGGNPSLTDQAVKEAVDFMIVNVK